MDEAEASNLKPREAYDEAMRRIDAAVEEGAYALDLGLKQANADGFSGCTEPVGRRAG